MTRLPRRSDFRDGRNYLAAVVSELAAPILRGAARLLVHHPPAAPNAWRSGLIVGHGHVGDVLYRTCSLDALATGLPACRWAYLTTLEGAAVLRGNPALTAVLPWQTGTSLRALDEDALRRLRETAYDVILCTENVRHHEALALALRLGIPNRVAFVRKGLSGLVTHPVWLDRPLPRAVQFSEMVAAVTGTPAARELRPQVFPNSADRRAAADEWARLGYGETDTVIACAITTRQQHGRVPAAFFTDVLQRVLRIAPRTRIVLCSVTEDRPALEEAALAIGADVSAGQLSILAYAAFLERCRAFFGTDSGARHVANAVGIPVVFVRNMATSAAEAGWYCPSEWDAAPPGEFLADGEIERRLEVTDREYIAETLAARARGM